MKPTFRVRAITAAVALGLFGLSAAAVAGPPIPPGATPAGTAFPPIHFTVQMGGLSGPTPGTPFTSGCQAGYFGSQSGTYEVQHSGSGWATTPDVTSSTCQPIPTLPALQPQCIVYTNAFGQYGYANNGCGYAFNTSAGLSGSYVWESQFRLLNSSGGVFNDTAWHVTWTGYCNGSGDGDGTCVGPNRGFAVSPGQVTDDNVDAYATVTSVIDPAVQETLTVPAAISAHDPAPVSQVRFDFAKVTIGCDTTSNPGGLYITGDTQTGSTVKCTGSYPTKFPKGALGFNMLVNVGSNSLSGVTATWQVISGSGVVLSTDPCLYGEPVSGSAIYCDTTQGNNERLTLKTPSGTQAYTFYIGPWTSTYK